MGSVLLVEVATPNLALEIGRKGRENDLVGVSQRGGNG